MAVPMLLTAGAALAHPGHDTAPAMGLFEGLEHVLTSPYHLGMLLGAVVVGLAGARVWRAARRSQRSTRSRRG
jgi:hydrogenase/urease accessory protein HupE